MSSSARLYGVPAGVIESIWPQVVPWVDKGLAYADGRYFQEDIYRFLQSGDMHLWIAIKDGEICGALITQTIIYPRKTVGLIFQLGGKGMRDWFHHLHTIEDCMRQAGCSCIELYGRPGWQRLLPDYRLEQVVLRKEL